jgi:hypothetical protein
VRSVSIGHRPINPRVLRARLIAPVAALAAVLATATVVRVARGSDDPYRDRVAAVCRGAYDELQRSPKTYLDAVWLVTSHKIAGLTRIEPPPARVALNDELVARERRLRAHADASVDSLEELGPQAWARLVLPRLQAEQARLDGLYRRELGISGCSR